MTCPLPVRGSARERGSATLEVLVLAPVMLAAVGFAIAGGRIETAHQAVDQAAYAAARQASIARDSGTARTLATSTARTMLTQRGLNCTAVAVDLDLSGFSAPLGQPATVRANISCVVGLSDLAVPGLPGGKQLTATAASPIDPYRERR